jgi:hypothetical protein
MPEVDLFIEFAQHYALEELGMNINDVPTHWVKDGLTNPAFYVSGKGVTKIHWGPILRRYGCPTPPVVLLQEIPKEKENDKEQTYWGHILHEFGHAAMDTVGKNDGEPNAWAFELMSLKKFMAWNQCPVTQADVKDFVLARRAGSCYTLFSAEFGDRAASAYKAITGEELQGARIAKKKEN